MELVWFFRYAMQLGPTGNERFLVLPRQLGFPLIFPQPLTLCATPMPVTISDVIRPTRLLWGISGHRGNTAHRA